MVAVTVELWLWMGDELNDDFCSPSAMRSVMTTQVTENTTVRDLFRDLAERHTPIQEKVFDMDRQCFRPHLVLTVNDRVSSPARAPDRVLESGDKITVLPMYMGG